jgi:hypothetical protein
VTQPPPFDVDAFLAQPLTARVTTNGPTVRPTWYLWEEGASWILTGPWPRCPPACGPTPPSRSWSTSATLPRAWSSRSSRVAARSSCPLTSPAAGASSAATLARTRHGGTAASGTTCTTIPPTRGRCGCGYVPILGGTRPELLGLTRPRRVSLRRPYTAPSLPAIAKHLRASNESQPLDLRCDRRTAQRCSWMRIRLPAGSRKAQSRTPYGCSIGSCTTSAASLACSRSKVPSRSFVARRIQP